MYIYIFIQEMLSINVLGAWALREPKESKGPQGTQGIQRTGNRIPKLIN